MCKAADYGEMMLMVIDSNVVFGTELEDNVDLSINRIISIMEEKKIDKALITNNKCKFYDFIEGNNETASIVNRYSGMFFGMASFNLSQLINVESEVRRSITDLGLAGIRFFNTDSNFTSGWGGGIDSLSVHMVLELINGLNVPVFLEGGYSFKIIKGLAEEFPCIPFIASGVGYGNMGEAILAARDRENLYLEISTLDSMDGINVLVEFLGPDKIIFGTGMPYNSPSCEILMVKTAGISEEDKQKIFSGNILGILDRRK